MEKFGEGRYVFDEKKYRENTKRTGVHDWHVETKISKIGDGTPVEVITPTMAVYEKEGVLPIWCRLESEK